MTQDIIPEWVYLLWAAQRRRESYHAKQLAETEDPKDADTHLLHQGWMEDAMRWRLTWERRIADAMVRHGISEVDTPLFTARLLPVPGSSRTELVIEVKEE